LFEGKIILITGGTGSLGQALTKRLLTLDVKSIRIFSRNESKQIEMENNFDDKRIRYFLGDIRDLDRLSRATEDVDIVFHAAAIKHVPKIEYNPFEAIKTNVIGSQNVIEACINANVEKAICVGTDKAVSPLNTYGATKLLMEKLFVTANNYLNKKRHKTKFIALRYGNVLGSSGSVIPLFINQIKNKQKITITDPKMTRFSITMDEALDFILESTLIGKGSEIFVPKLRSYEIEGVKDALFEMIGKVEVEHIGIRSGEKLHETLINENELINTFELDNKFMILKTDTIKENLNLYDSIKKSDIKKIYSSDSVEKISKEELKKNISKEMNQIL
jgi:UDP-N-acetylglucosamine 4,6-dehydratase